MTQPDFKRAYEGPAPGVDSKALVALNNNFCLLAEELVRFMHETKVMLATALELPAEYLLERARQREADEARDAQEETGF